MRIHINIGSNKDREKNIKEAIVGIKKYFHNTEFSSVYETEAFGFKGDNFYNIGVNAITDKSLLETFKILRCLEKNIGRIRNTEKFSSREIDLDLILFGDLVNKENNIPRDDILKFPFVLAPLSEIMPQDLHPEIKKNFFDLWEDHQRKYDPKYSKLENSKDLIP